MFRVSIAVHLSPEGEVTILSASQEGEKAIKARNECELPGEVGLFINEQPQKLKKNRPTAAKSAPVKAPAKKQTKAKGKK
jgi:hypothetical protein|tara:strand:+ start:1060 stop:1299 length:240 start_codon:yes stop_codon:yes gene_type:complete